MQHLQGCSTQSKVLAVVIMFKICITIYTGLTGRLVLYTVNVDMFTLYIFLRFSRLSNICVAVHIQCVAIHIGLFNIIIVDT